MRIISWRWRAGVQPAWSLDPFSYCCKAEWGAFRSGFQENTLRPRSYLLYTDWRTGLVLLALLFAGWPSTLSAQQPKMEMVKIAENVYTMVDVSGGGTSNSTFIVTSEGVVVFDHYVIHSYQTLAAIRKLTDKKIVYLFSSHAAGDHSTGAWYFREDKPVYIATKNQLPSLLAEGLPLFKERAASSDPRYAIYRGKELVLPDILIAQSMTLRLGGLTFEATFEGFGHSPGDLTLYIPQKRVFLMGDLLNNDMHAGGGQVVPGEGSNPKGWIEVLDHIIARRLPVDTYVPGHGPVHIGRGVKDVEEARNYFVIMRDAVAKMMAEGKTLEQIQKEFQVPAEFSRYSRRERLESTLPLYYYELLGVSK